MPLFMLQAIRVKPWGYGVLLLNESIIYASKLFVHHMRTIGCEGGETLTFAKGIVFKGRL